VRDDDARCGGRAALPTRVCSVCCWSAGRKLSITRMLPSSPGWQAAGGAAMLARTRAATFYDSHHLSRGRPYSSSCLSRLLIASPPGMLGGRAGGRARGRLGSAAVVVLRVRRDTLRTPSLVPYCGVKGARVPACCACSPDHPQGPQPPRRARNCAATLGVAARVAARPARR
jgi:hypothetical protein